MTRPSLFERLRSARLVQVGAVYLGASWVVLQIVDTLQGLLSLPEWVGPVAVLLLLVGLVVVAATAWVQSLPQTTAAEEAGEVPTDWEVAPADALASLSRGRLPHLTWGRAVTGGVVALSLLFGLAGLTVLVRGPSGILGPQAARADGTAEGIAVLPFRMNGEGMDVYREGIPDLMSTNLDGLSEYRAIDSRTLLARWNREIGETADVELARALRVAGALGARYAVVGVGLDAGSEVRLTAEIYDVADGRRVGEGAMVEGGEDEVLGLIDRLTVNVMRSFLAGSGTASQTQALRVASLLTESVPALRHYLEGDALFRRSRFEEARASFEQAVRDDSTFALAYWRLGDTYGWTEDVNSPRSREYRARAAQYADRLPERERTLLTIQTAIVNAAFGDEDLARLRDYLDRYPDDPDGWYLLGEVGLHSTGPTGVTDAEIEEALYRTVELDPGFGPYYEHALQWATAKGHADRYAALTAAAERVAPERLERMRIRWALFQGDETERAAAELEIAARSRESLGRIDQGSIAYVDAELGRLRPLGVGQVDPQWVDAVIYGQQGRLAELVQLAERANEEALVEAVRQVADWAEAAPVPDELVIRLDRTVGPRTIEDGEIWGARVLLDRLMGRGIDREAYLEWSSRSFDEFLPILAARFDTAGFRGGARTFAEAELLAWSGRAEVASGMFEDVREAIPIDPPTDVTLQRGLIALQAGAYDDAIAALESASRGERRTLVKFHLGQAYEATGDTAKALDAYRTFLSRAAPADEGLGAVLQAREAVARLGG